MKKFIWVLGSPRSGTTFFTNYIGKYTDKKYNEPWETHPIETPRLWQFPAEAKTIVFKYCENWKNLHALMHRWSDSIYVNIWRDPDNVVYSMANQKPGSYPPRNLYGNLEGDEKLRVCMQRWYSNTMYSLSIINIIPSQYCEIHYENANPGLQKLSEMSGINFNLEDLKFNNRNMGLNLDWGLNPTARQLRNLIKQHQEDGLLAEFINKKKPKLLQRVVL